MTDKPMNAEEEAAYMAGFIDGYTIMQEKCHEVSQFSGEIDFSDLLKLAKNTAKKCIRVPHP